MGRSTWLGTTDPYVRVKKIRTLDPERDSREICKLFYQDFLSLMVVPALGGYMLANGAPRQSRILISTGELEHRVAKRFVDTALLGTAVLEHGVAKPGPGRDAARRVNAMHRSYDIHPEDMLAFGASQVLLAIEAAERLGWRPVTQIEREALRVHYAGETKLFGGRLPMPESLDEVAEFFDDYQEKQLRFEPQNLRLANVLLDFLCTLFPAPLRPWTSTLLLAQLDPRIIRACGLTEPSLLSRRLSDSAFRLIGARDPLPDSAPNLFEMLIARVYPQGYTIQSLGTKHNAPDALVFDEPSSAGEGQGGGQGSTGALSR